MTTDNDENLGVGSEHDESGNEVCQSRPRQQYTLLLAGDRGHQKLPAEVPLCRWICGTLQVDGHDDKTLCCYRSAPVGRTTVVRDLWNPSQWPWICGTQQPGGGQDDAADPDERDGDVEQAVGEHGPVGHWLDDDATLDDRSHHQQPDGRHPECVLRDHLHALTSGTSKLTFARD